jgi:lipocalin
MISLYLYGRKYPRFKITKDLPTDFFVGTYIQIMRTPNIFQKTNFATATYTKNTVKNIEWKYTGDQLIIGKTIEGTYRKTDVGTFKIKFKYVPVEGYYRILDYEINSLGTFLCVTSSTPKNSWILWKPPTEKYDFDAAYDHAILKKCVLQEIGLKKFLIADRDIVQKLANVKKIELT